jgi:hypothetical protein
MNFDFIRELDGLNRAFDSCSNAEELAISMPDLSMIASRKSAEVLAKFVYLVSHSAEAEELSFADILSNDVVKRYLNRNILDAFHFIRRNGNVAVHTLENKTSKESLDVLKNLHYAFGEVAKRMRLINQYPQFNSNIVANDFAQLEDVDINALAKDAYVDYLNCQNRVERLRIQFANKYARIRIIPGLVDLNEIIEFKAQPLSKETVSLVQEHFGFLAMYALNAMQESSTDSEDKIAYSAELIIYGENGYATRNPVKFAEGVLYDLPNAEGFKIVSHYQGPSIASWFNEEVREEFRSVVSKMGKTEMFTYSVFEFLYNHGAGGCAKFEDGKWIDLSQQFSNDIIDRDFGQDWWCWNVDLCIEFDFKKHENILKTLQDTVRKHIPADQIQYCENVWEDGEEQILLNSIDWTPRTLRPIQTFLDEINAILNPIISECDGWSGDLGLYQIHGPFAVADIVWTDKGFMIKSVEL